jgi:transposase InsO family protein
MMAHSGNHVIGDNHLIGSAVALVSRSNAAANEIWLADSGASEHMTSQRHLFQTFRELEPGTCTITIADKSQMQCLGVGDIEMRSQVGKKWTTITLKNVLFVPELGRNLFSISAASRNGCKITMFDNGCVIEKQGKVMAEGTVCGKLYCMKFSPIPGKEANVSISTRNTAAAAATSAPRAVSLQQWHERLAHANHQIVRRAIGSHETVSDPCTGCLLGKQHRSSFPKGPKRRESIPGMLIHADTCGPCTPVSLSGSKYFLLMKDDATNLMFVYFMRTKEESLTAIRTFLLDWEHTVGTKVKGLQTDNGTELVNRQVESLLLSKDIRHQYSIAYNPEMNGFIERAIRTVCESARSMLRASKLQTNLWAEAVQTAVHILNKLPNKAQDYKSPHEAATGNKPILSHARIFGSDAYVHVRDEQRTKWDEKTKLHVLVGYHPELMAFRVMDPETGKVTTKRDVVIVEPRGRNNWNMSTNASQVEDFLSPEEHERLSRSSGRVDEVVSFDMDGSLPSSFSYDVPPNAGNSGQEAPAYSNPGPGPSTGAIPKRKPKAAPPTSRMTRSQKDLTSVQWKTVTGSLPEDEVTGSDEANLAFAFAASLDPLTVKQALTSAESDKWKEAMQREMDSLAAQEAWILVPRPKDRNIVKSRWVSRTKYRSDGTIDKFKARLVAKGYSQKEGIDYEETFSPVVRFDTVRLLLSVIKAKKMQVKQIDVVGAYLYASLDEDI